MYSDPPYDDRASLGYGKTKNTFHKPRSLGSVYPYIEEDETLEYEDLESEEAIGKKTYSPLKTDFFANPGTDSFYFVAGNTRLSACFERPDQVLEEIHALGDSMSPISTKYSRTGMSGGAAHSSGVSNYKRTGTKKGYFSAPPRLKLPDENIPKEEQEDKPVKNLRDLADKQDKIKGNFSVR